VFAKAAAVTPSSSARDKEPGSATASNPKKVQVDEGTKTGGQVRVWQQKGGWAVVCKELLGKLLKNKRVWPFENPVDPKALKLGDYKKIVKKPMDLGTVGTKLEEGKYKNLEQSGEEFYKDVVLTFDNALLYNPEGDEIWEHAASLKATFEELWAKVLEPAKGGQAAVSSKAETPVGAGKGAVAKSDAASQSWQEWAAGMVRKMVKAGYSKGLREPMDAKAMGLSDYKKKVKEPMDLGPWRASCWARSMGRWRRLRRMCVWWQSMPCSTLRKSMRCTSRRSNFWMSLRKSSRFSSASRRTCGQRSRRLIASTRARRLRVVPARGHSRAGRSAPWGRRCACFLMMACGTRGQ
jgi:hypothetical protein